MIKFDYLASTMQFVSTPDSDLLTYPNSDWFRSIVMRVAGRTTGSNAQYIFSNNGSATGAVNLAFLPEGDSTAANRRKLALYINNAVTPRVGTTAFADGQEVVIFLQRETDVCTLYSCPILATAPTDGSAVVTELSFAMTTSYNGSGGFYVASRSDMLAARLSDQAFGHLKAINRALTKLEMAKIAYGMRLVDLGYTPLLEVGMVNLSDVVDTSPNAFPFTVNGSPSAAAEPAFGFTPPVPVPAAIDVTSPVADRVIQRGFPVPLNGTYAGDAPATIEYRLYAPDGVTARTAWTPIPNATIADGNWSGGPTLPKGATDADRIAVRSKNSTGAVIVQSAVKSALFFVGGLVATIGSSSAALLYASNSGTGFTAAGNVRKMSSSSFTWGTLGTAGAATLFANSLAQQSGMPIGMLAYGDSGTTLADWLGSSAMWTNFANAVAAAGGKLEAAYITVGSNDAATGSITSRAAHLTNMKALVDRVRALTGQPDLPIMWSGSNRRPALSTTQSSYLRMAENDIGDYANVSHVQTIDFEIASDNIHLSANPGGFPASIARAGYVWGRRLYGDGVYVRGPKNAAFTFSGDTVTATPQLRNGTASGLTPTSDFTGFTVTDSAGAPNVLTRTIVDGRPTIKYDRALVAPVKVTYLSGGNPDASALIYDNGTTPLPMHVETDLAATDGAPPQDVAPTLSGATAAATGATTASGSVTTDEAGGTLYWLFSTSQTVTAAQVKAGNSKTVNASGVQNVTGTSLTPSTQYYLHLLHRDSGGLDSLIATSVPLTTQSAGSTVTSVTISPTSVTVAGGASQQFTAAALGTGSPSQAMTWTRSPAAGSVSSAGLYTAPAATGSDQIITVTATSQQDSTKSASAVVTVPAAVGPDPDPDPEVPDERNYTWLQTEVVDWLHRPDLASKVPKFITMAEARINRIVQARGMEIEAALSFGTGIGAVRLPTGFDTPIAAWVNCDTGRRALGGVTPEQLSGTTQRGEPQYWAIDGAYLAIDCPPDRARTVTLRYRGLLRLSDAAPNNSVLSKYPDVYLYGALMEAALYTRDPDSLSNWSALFDSAMKELNRNESRARAIAPLRTELAALLGCR